MTTILVTGGTAQLGTPTVARLRAAGHDVRVLSRAGGPGTVPGDLISGSGIRSALDGVETLVHLASTNSAKDDVAATTALLAAAADAGVAHVVMISIVGIDDIPLGYYVGRVGMERALRASGLPYSLLRATQFHSFVERLFTAQRFSPVIVAPKFSFQTIAVDEVAARLVELAGSSSSGRVADIGGPRRLTGAAMAALWKASVGSRRPVLRLTPPGAAMRGFSAGHNLVPGTPYGHGTFAEYLAGQPR